MNATSMSRRGFSLVEVMVALVVLVIGVFAAVQLQALALRNTALADAIARTTRVVRSEIEWQRYTDFDLSQNTCVSTDANNQGMQSCEVSIVQCAFDLAPAGGGRASLSCTGGSDQFFAVTVNAVGPRDQALSLGTLWTGVYVTGGVVQEDSP